MIRRLRVIAGAAALAIACHFGTDTSLFSPVHLIVTPESLAFRGRAGDTLLPDRYLTLNSVEKVKGRWAAFEDGSWFFLAAGDGDLPSLVAVAPRPGGLGPGTYAASIWVVAGTETVRVPVTLDLAPVASVTGRWAGRADTLHIALQLTQQGSAVTGSGTVGAPVGSVAATGTWTDPNLSLVLDGSADTLRLTAALQDDNVLSGTLARSATPGAPPVPLVLYRQ